MESCTLFANTLYIKVECFILYIVISDVGNIRAEILRDHNACKDKRKECRSGRNYNEAFLKYSHGSL